MPEGKCPKCGADLSYGVLEPLDGTEVSYPVSCHKCGWHGNEFYGLKYVTLVDREGKHYP
jgi:predicted nucleic-acid-binding Zn-ribbon protein